MEEKLNQVRVVFLFIVLLISLGVVTAAINQTILPSLPNQTQPLTPALQNILANNPKLATIVNGQSIDTEYIREYLKVYNSFADITYQNVGRGDITRVTLTVGNREDNIKGFEINGKRYVVHLILCNYKTKECAFRINGIPTGAKSSFKHAQNASSSFDLDNTYQIRIDSVRTDFCDNRRFCNLHFEAYDIVNVTVKPR